MIGWDQLASALETEIREDRDVVLLANGLPGPALAALAERPSDVRLVDVGRASARASVISAPSRIDLALRALRDAKPRVVVALQSQRKLELLAVLSARSRAFVVRDGELLRIRRRDFLRRQLAATRGDVQRQLARWLHPEPPVHAPVGPGNDHGFIESVTSRDAARLRVLVALTHPAPTGNVISGQTYPEHLIEVRPASSATLRASTADVVVFLDGRAEVREDWLWAHLSWFHGTAQPLVVLGRPGDLRTDPAPHAKLTPASFSARRSLLTALDTSDASPRELGRRLMNRGAYFIAEPSAEVSLGPAPAWPFGREASPPPAVSIYIPAYNAARWIERTVGSALAQTIESLEVVVCDDGSTDATAEILHDRFASDPRVRVQQQPNGGIGAASNVAVNMARADFVLQLDADDELLPTAAETLLAVMTRDPRIALAYGGYEVADPSRLLYENRYRVPPAYDPQRHLLGQIITHPRMFRARDFHRTEGFDETIENAVDFDIYLKLSERGRVEAVPEVLYRYHIHGENTSYARRETQYRNHIYVIRRALQRRGLADWDVRVPDPVHEPRRAVLEHRRERWVRHARELLSHREPAREE